MPDGSFSQACRRSWSMPSRNLAVNPSRSAFAVVRARRSSYALRILSDSHADRTKQLQILQTLGEVRHPAAVPAMLHLACDLSHNALRFAALIALTGYDDPAIPSAVIKACPSMSDDVLASAQSMLASRRPWTNEFLKSIEAGQINARSVPKEIVEKLMLLGRSRDQQHNHPPLGIFRNPFRLLNITPGSPTSPP